MSLCSGSEDLLWQFEKEVSRVSKVSPDQVFQQERFFFGLREERVARQNCRR